jgi:hypothetical protein
MFSRPNLKQRFVCLYWISIFCDLSVQWYFERERAKLSLDIMARRNRKLSFKIFRNVFATQPETTFRVLILNKYFLWFIRWLIFRKSLAIYVEKNDLFSQLWHAALRSTDGDGRVILQQGRKTPMFIGDAHVGGRVTKTTRNTHQSVKKARVNSAFSPEVVILPRVIIVPLILRSILEWEEQDSAHESLTKIRKLKIGVYVLVLQVYYVYRVHTTKSYSPKSNYKASCDHLLIEN